MPVICVSTSVSCGDVAHATNHILENKVFLHPKCCSSDCTKRAEGLGLGAGGRGSPPVLARDRPDCPDCLGSLPPAARGSSVSKAACGFRQRNDIPQADCESDEISLFRFQLRRPSRRGHTQSKPHGVARSTRRHAPPGGYETERRPWQPINKAATGMLATCSRSHRRSARNPPPLPTAPSRRARPCVSRSPRVPSFPAPSPGSATGPRYFQAQILP